MFKLFNSAKVKGNSMQFSFDLSPFLNYTYPVVRVEGAPRGLERTVETNEV